MGCYVNRRGHRFHNSVGGAGRYVGCFLLVVVTLSLTACEARTAIDVDVDPNGGGNVGVSIRLDEQAVAMSPRLSEQLRTDDLKKAGWRVDGPKKGKDGKTVIKFVHDFSNSDEANRIMAQLGGPVVDFQLSEKRSLAKLDTSFTGTIDLSKGVESFGDQKLVTTFGSALGFDTKEAEQALGGDWSKDFPVGLTVHLPGSVDNVWPAQSEKGTWTVLGGTTATMHAESSGFHLLPLAFYVLAPIFLIAASTVALLWKSGKYKPKHRKRNGGIRARDLAKKLSAS